MKYPILVKNEKQVKLNDFLHLYVLYLFID